MSAALSLNMTPAATTPEIENANAAVVELIESARTLVETTQTALEGLDGAAKNELAKSLAAVLAAVAVRLAK